MSCLSLSLMSSVRVLLMVSLFDFNFESSLSIC